MAGLAAATAFVPVTAVAEQADARPNIILITADDMRADDIRVMDNVRGLLTEQGTTFPNSYSSFPLCGPSRASLVTGQYAHNHGVLANTRPLGGFDALDSSNTLPIWLDDAGYQTTFLGKYVNGFGNTRPLSVPPGWDDFRASLKDGDYFNTQIFENGTETSYTDYQTDLYADLGSDLITRDASGDEPFFLWASFYAPHAGNPVEPDDPSMVFGSDVATPAVAPRHTDAYADLPLPQPPNYNEADVSDKPSGISSLAPLSEENQQVITELNQQRLESLLALDEAIAQMMAALADSEELDNTVIMFTSDNGLMLGEHRRVSGKIVPYEASARVPLVIRGPGFPAGQVRDQLVANVDLVPTLLDLANGRAGLDLDGMSLLPLAADPENRPQRALVMEAGPDVADGPWFYRGIRTEQWLYIEYEQTGERELYDMANDPYQLQSLHADPAYDRQRLALADQLSALRDCAGEACRPGSPPDASHRDPHPDAETDAAPAAEDAQSSSTFAIGAALAGAAVLLVLTAFLTRRRRHPPAGEK
ncbi:MAG: sulfatase [Actinomycetota bacterium]|nr:sulfatase [Actinomycetota bacterium]